jgi:hypothetical protein
VERLRAKVLQEFGGSERRETGGLLVGRRPLSATGRRTVEIVDFEPVPCSHESLYVTSQTDKNLLEKRCAALSCNQAGTIAVGFYRSRYGGPVRLDHSDAELAYRLFPTPDSVFLALDESGPEAVTGGFFCWDPTGTLQTDSSAMEFPLDAQALRQMQQVTGALAAPSPRRQLQPPQQALPAREDDSLMQAEPPARAPLEKRAAVFTPRRYVLLAASVLFCAILGILTALGTRRSPRPDVSDNVDVLHVEQDGADVKLSWSKSPWFGGASTAVLSVRDGDYFREFVVDPRLDSGMLLYTPMTNDLEFRIRVLASSVERTQSVRVLVDKPGAFRSAASISRIPDYPPAVNGREPRLGGSAVIPVSRSHPTKEDATVSHSLSPAPVVQTRPLMLPAAKMAAGGPLPSPPELRTAVSLPGLALPHSTPNLTGPPAAVAGKPERAPVASLPPPQRMAVERSEPASPVAAINVPPQPVKRVLPRFLPVLRAMIPPNSSVDVTVQVSETGSVTSAAVSGANGVSERSPTAKLAENAARSWKFQPATLRGRNVASQMVIHFVLTP